MLETNYLIQLLPPGLAALVTILLVPLTIAFSKRFGLSDNPSARKVHTAPIPRIGGLAILFGVLTGMACTVILVPISGYEVTQTFWTQFLGLSISATFVWAVGFVDDIRTVSSRFKLFALLFASTLMWGSGPRWWLSTSEVIM